MKTITLITLLFSFSSYAVQEITFSASAFSSTVKELGAEDLKSSNEPSFSVGYKWFIGTYVHFLLEMENRNYKFNLDDSIVTGDSEISLQRFDIGFRFVLTPKSAISVFGSKAEVLNFKLSNNEIELLSEDLSFLSLNYNQVLAQFRPFNIGFDVTYDFEASSGDVENRTQVSGRLYSIIGRSGHRARIFAGGEMENKTIGTDDIKTTNTIAGLEYIFRF